jgi:DsbC/DsbD-like thiol-disulfide interchange protein
MFKLLSSLIILTISVLYAVPVKSGKVTASLLVKHSSVPAGGSSIVALQLTPDKGWHTYWQNPGAAGMPTSVKWELPEGISVSELQFPAPHVFESTNMKFLGYKDEIFLLAELRISKDTKPGKYEIIGNASWLACIDIECIPGDAKTKVSIDVLPAKQNTVASTSAETITKAEGKIPPAAKGWSGVCKRIDNKLELRIKPPQGIKLDASGLNVFIVQQSVVVDGETTDWKIEDGEIIGQLPVSEYLKELPPIIDLVLLETGHEIGVKIACECKK